MSHWTHNICVDCWLAQQECERHELEDTGREGPPDVCCFCGKATTSGIYIRADPEETLCKGEHEEDPIEEPRTIAAIWDPKRTMLLDPDGGRPP